MFNGIIIDKPEYTTTHLTVHIYFCRLNLKIEPIFASMALYDVREKRKVSENFYSLRQ